MVITLDFPARFAPKFGSTIHPLFSVSPAFVMLFRLSCLVVVVATVLHGTPLRVWSDEPRPALPDSMAYLDNGTIKIGVDLQRGGSIGFLAEVQTGKSVVNVHDFGRWIGQSYYSGPQPFGEAHPGWKNWPWNPISAGDVYGNSSTLLDHTNDGKTLYVRSIPMQWALKQVSGDCTFETWIELEGRTAHVRNRLTNQRADTKRYRAMDQELPAVYSIGTLYRLKSYTGDKPFMNDPVSEIRIDCMSNRNQSGAHSSRRNTGPRWSTMTTGD